MPEAKIFQHRAYFVRESSGVSDADNKPTFSASDAIGVVNSSTHRNENDFQVFDKPVGGTWVDSEVKASRDRETFTLEVGQVSELFWELVRNVNVTLSGGAASYVPGSKSVHKGWLQIVTVDDDGDTVDTLERWCHIYIDTATIPKGQLVTATINGRKLYSTENAGSFANIV